MRLKMNETIDESQIIMMANQSSRIRIVPRQSKDITIFIDDVVEQPSLYRDELFTIVNATEYDEISIVLNTVGGQLSTALAIKEALGVCNATSTAILMGECASAGTIIALSCNNVAVLDSATFMIHTAKFGSGGNTNNVKDHVDFTHSQINKLIDTTYAGFLTKPEIEQVKNGKEFWMDAEEIKKRLAIRTKYFDALDKQASKEETKKKTKKESKETTELLLEG